MRAEVRDAMNAAYPYLYIDIYEYMHLSMIAFMYLNWHPHFVLPAIIWRPRKRAAGATAAATPRGADPGLIRPDLGGDFEIHGRHGTCMVW